MSAPTMTKAGSAYPVPVEELVPLVRDRARELGRVPSQNQVMGEYRVGVGKARAVLAALRDSGFDPATDTAADTIETGGSTNSDPVRENTREPVTEGIEVQVSQHGAPVSDSAPEPVSTSALGGGEVAGGGEHAVPPVSAPAPAGPVPRPSSGRRWQVLSLVLLSLPAFVAIWGGWVGLGRMTGFGDVELLPGIADGWTIDSAITLPIGVETYAAFALRVWLSRDMTANRQARRFAMWSAFAALALGMTGQVAYHLMTAAGITVAPWPITTVVACLPVAVLGSGAALAHLMHTGENQ